VGEEPETLAKPAKAIPQVPIAVNTARASNAAVPPSSGRARIGGPTARPAPTAHPAPTATTNDQPYPRASLNNEQSSNKTRSKYRRWGIVGKLAKLRENDSRKYRRWGWSERLASPRERFLQVSFGGRVGEAGWVAQRFPQVLSVGIVGNVGHARESGFRRYRLVGRAGVLA
jgi:hypothetical protein